MTTTTRQKQPTRRPRGLGKIVQYVERKEAKRERGEPDNGDILQEVGETLEDLSKRLIALAGGEVLTNEQAETKKEIDKIMSSMLQSKGRKQATRQAS